MTKGRRIPFRAMRTLLRRGFAPLVAAVLTVFAWPATAVEDQDAYPRTKRVIGPVSQVEETVTEISFSARVDTGATTCSIHVEGWQIENPSESMEGDVGKTIRFCLKNRRGETGWIESKIAEVATIKTSEREEQRYKVLLTLLCENVKKRIPCVAE